MPDNSHPERLLQFIRKAIPDISWNHARDYGFLLVGALVQALSLRLFLIPGQLVSGGISGAAQLINFYTNFPIGVMVLLGNAPLFLLGWRYLGGPRFVLRTAIAILAFSLLTDLLVLWVPAVGVTGDLFLNTLYGGLMLGVGLGLVYRGQGTSGGSDILGRILNHKTGISISQAYLITDSIVILSAGFVFGWNNALYALVMTYVSGLAAEFTMEGTDVFRTAIIVTEKSEEVTAQILNEMERGVTILSGRGAYTSMERPVLFCVVTRTEVSQLKALVREIDPSAFMVIGQAHEALGEGFRPLK
jgi:uncharacterized membrane-anchored protein YitT (DUF2179 family)